MAATNASGKAAAAADGPATILAIGTANPSNVIDQMQYPEYYFRITNSQCKTDLLQKFQRVCEFSRIEFRV